MSEQLVGRPVGIGTHNSTCKRWAGNGKSPFETDGLDKPTAMRYD
jgi:hypothetical protein